MRGKIFLNGVPYDLSQPSESSGMAYKQWLQVLTNVSLCLWSDCDLTKTTGPFHRPGGSIIKSYQGSECHTLLIVCISKPVAATFIDTGSVWLGCDDDLPQKPRTSCWWRHELTPFYFPDIYGVRGTGAVNLAVLSTVLFLSSDNPCIIELHSSSWRLHISLWSTRRTWSILFRCFDT